MSTKRPTRADAAGRAYLDLRRLARGDGRATDEYLRLYILEGFLARLAQSNHVDRLVIKGGVLMAAHAMRRPTADVDIAAQGIPGQVAEIRELVSAIASGPRQLAERQRRRRLIPVAHGVRQDQQRKPGRDQSDQVRDEERPTTVLVGDVREPPDIAEPDRRPDRGHDEAGPRAPTARAAPACHGLPPLPAIHRRRCAASTAQ